MTYFSVIIPTYNRDAFIEKAINSVLRQTYQDFEIIIIDDASTDNTNKIISNIDSNKIKYVRNIENIERCNSRNKGIELAQGKYICFLDSDDYHLPNHLETLYNKIQELNEPKALLFTNAKGYNHKNNEFSERHCPDIENYNTFDYIATYTFNPQRMCIHKDICNEFLFDPNIFVCEDLDFAARIATKHEIIQIKEITTVYVYHEDSFTGGDSLKPFKELENYNKIFDKTELKNTFSKKSKNRLKSMCYFHISIWYNKKKQWSRMYSAIIKSFILYPAGYNGKTNKIMLVSAIKNAPLIRSIWR